MILATQKSKFTVFYQFANKSWLDSMEIAFRAVYYIFVQAGDIRIRASLLKGSTFHYHKVVRPTLRNLVFPLSSP